MLEHLLSAFETLTGWLWFPVGVILLLGLGLALTVRARLMQLRKFPRAMGLFWHFLRKKKDGCEGIHPLKAMFASLGGCIGVGNVVAVIIAIQLGGPGALLWIWVAGFLGMIIKYSEVYLGMLHRVRNEAGGYNGGPMYFLPKAFNWRWIVPAVCVLLCVYGVDSFMFNVMADSISTNWHINPLIVIGVLLGLVLLAVRGGVARVGSVCGAIIPFFVLVYSGMAAWVVFHNLDAVPSVLATIFSSAFTGHAAVGGFAGATIMQAMGQGFAKGCYSGDVGIGYDSVLHSESTCQKPAHQASLTILIIFLDTFVVCTTSVALVLLTGVWNQGIPATIAVQTALAQYFPYMNIFMPFFLFMLAYSTLIAYMAVGLKSARHLSPRYGPRFYYAYAIASLIGFSFLGSERVFTIMSCAGALLLLINLTAIFRLRKQLSFHVE
jgi:AGCS family alanine or glycine:cation symporter